MRAPLLLVVGLGALATAGCGVLLSAASEEVEQKVREQANPGEIPPEPPVVVGDPVTVNSVLPNRGLVSGGLFVEIVGLGFETGAQVYFGAAMATDADTTSGSESPSRSAAATARALSAGRPRFVGAKLPPPRLRYRRTTSRAKEAAFQKVSSSWVSSQSATRKSMQASTQPTCPSA